jgi:predicted Zn-dependent protease
VSGAWTQSARRPRFLHAGCVAGALALGAGCVVSRASRPPPLTASSVTLERDEQRLRREAAELDERARRSGAVRAEPSLERYLLGVAQRLVPRAAQPRLDTRVRVIDSPSLTAFAVADGGIYLSVGLLARLESEAQLAVVLAHEVTHVVNRHPVITYRTYKQGAATAITSLPFALGESAIEAAVSGYTRDLEREADAGGLALVAARGWDVSQAARPFEFLAAWVEEEKIEEPSAYATHPKLTERIASYRSLLATTYAGHKGGEEGVGRYRAATAHLVLAAARLDLAAGRFGPALRGARAYLTFGPRKAEAQALLGDIARQARSQGSEETALRHYREAVALDPSCAEAQRGLGFALSRKGERAGARAALESYLQLRPDAADRAWVERELADLKGGAR